MTRISVWGALILTIGGEMPMALALEDCNTNPKSGQDIAEALQCLDRNIKSLAQQSGPGSPSQSGNITMSGKYVAGMYTSPDGKQKFQLSGPTKIGDRERWQLNSDDGTIQISWITGVPKGNPLLPEDETTDKLSPAYDYGRLGKESAIEGVWWMRGGLIGITPMNDGLTISRLHDAYAKSIAVEIASFSVRLSKAGK